MAMVFKKCAKYYRLTNQIDFISTNLCQYLLFDRENFPTNNEMLYHELEKRIHKENFHEANLMRIFPYSKKTNVHEWNLTLFMKVIQELFGLKYSRLLRDLKKLSNQLLNKGNKYLSDDEYENFCCRAGEIFRYHESNFNMRIESVWDDIMPLENRSRNIKMLTNQGNVNVFLLI